MDERRRAHAKIVVAQATGKRVRLTHQEARWALRILGVPLDEDPDLRELIEEAVVPASGIWLSARIVPWEGENDAWSD